MSNTNTPNVSGNWPDGFDRVQNIDFNLGPRVSLNPELRIYIPGKDVIAALESGNDQLLWRLYRNSEDPMAFLEVVRTHVFRHSFRAKLDRHPFVEVPFHASLFAIPLVLAPQMRALLRAGESTTQAFQSIAQQLTHWFGPAVRPYLICPAIAYAELANWGPLLTKQRLVRFSNSPPIPDPSPQVRTQAELFLPDDAPLLAFIVGCVNRAFVPPEIVSGSAREDWPLLQITNSALNWSLLEKDSWGVNELMACGPPKPFGQAIEFGLERWFDSLAAYPGLHAWDAWPAGEDITVFQLLIGSHESEHGFHWIRVPVREFHLEPNGLIRLFERLYSIASRNAFGSGL